MHLHFERSINTKCDCTILTLSWMGKVPDQLPEDEGWKLNRTNYYQEGWLATGNVRGIIGVTFTTSHCNKSLETPPRTNYNLRGHRSDVILVKWNEPYQKLASCDSSGVIFVWIKYEGRWSIELINDRNTRVTHFSWSHDGRMALICYQDNFVLVGSVAGQRYWSSMLNLDCTINCGIWTPDDQLVYFGTSNGQLVVMDVHGAMMAQVEVANQVAITSMAWSCEKFKMEESDDNSNECSGKYVLAISLENGVVLLMKHYYDVSPVQICTGLCPLSIEWSNNRQLLAVAGTRPNTEFLNQVQVYTDNGMLLYSSLIPFNLSPVTAMTWGHNDKRLFIATGCLVHVAWVSTRIASLQLLSSLEVYNSLQGNSQQISNLPLPLRIQHRLSKLFVQTIRWCIPETISLGDFVSRPPRVRLHCTMLRHDEDSAANCYTLFLEYLGGLVPLLKGKRTSKLKPEFVIFDPQAGDCSCINVATSSSSSGTYSGSERDDSECEDSCASPRLRRRNRHHSNSVYSYADTLPEESRLALVTSNIWGTKFRIHGLSDKLAANLGSVLYKTSLLHLQPRQMTLAMWGEGGNGSGGGSGFGATSELPSETDDEEEDEARSKRPEPAVAPLRPKCRLPPSYANSGTNSESKASSSALREGFMTRSSYNSRDCECGVGQVPGIEPEEHQIAARGARTGVVRSCSVGYLDLVENGGASNARLVLVRQKAIKPARLTGKSRSLDSSEMASGAVVSLDGTIPLTPRPILPPAPSSSPSSPAAVKKKRNHSHSPIRSRIMNSPLLPRRLRSRANKPDADGYQDLESFQKAQLRNKIETTAKRREFVMHNKAPMWNEMSQVYQLDFGGRVTQESAKNFQVEFRGKQVMQFGRIDGNAYTLDFQYPFSAVQAFAVALANVTQRLK